MTLDGLPYVGISHQHSKYVHRNRLRQVGNDQQHSFRDDIKGFDN